MLIATKPGRVFTYNDELPTILYISTTSRPVAVKLGKVTVREFHA